MKESLILKTFQESSDKKGFLQEKYTKKNTFEWDLIRINVIHQISTHAKDEEAQILQLLELLISDTSCDSSVIEDMTKAQRTPLMNACIKGNMKAV